MSSRTKRNTSTRPSLAPSQTKRYRTRSVSRKEEEERKEKAASTIQRILIREVDPISLGPIRVPFRLLREGKSLLFDATTLLKYIRSSGDTRDPLARRDLLPHERSRLCRACKVGSLLQRDESRLQTLSLLEEEFMNEVTRHDTRLSVAMSLYSSLTSLASQEEFSSSLSRMRENGIHVSSEGENGRLQIVVSNPSPFLPHIDSLLLSPPSSRSISESFSLPRSLLPAFMAASAVSDRERSN